jgi:hypothetical protein
MKTRIGPLRVQGQEVRLWKRLRPDLALANKGLQKTIEPKEKFQKSLLNTGF